MAKEVITVTDEVKSRAADLTGYKLKALDALHLSLAEKGKATYFCTVDDGIFRCSKRVKDLSVRVIKSVDLVQEIEK